MIVYRRKHNIWGRSKKMPRGRIPLNVRGEAVGFGAPSTRRSCQPTYTPLCKLSKVVQNPTVALKPTTVPAPSCPNTPDLGHLLVCWRTPTVPVHFRIVDVTLYIWPMRNRTARKVD